MNNTSTISLDLIYSIANGGKWKLFGPIIKGIIAIYSNIPLTFKVDASKTGKAPLDVDIRSDRGNITFLSILSVLTVRVLFWKQTKKCLT